MKRRFESKGTDVFSLFGTGLTLAATLVCVGILAVILGYLLWLGAPQLSWWTRTMATSSRWPASPATTLIHLSSN